MTTQDFMKKYDLTKNQVIYGCVRGLFESTVHSIAKKGYGGARWQRDIPESEKNLEAVNRLKKLNRKCSTREVEKANEIVDDDEPYRNDLMGSECKKSNYYSRGVKRVRSVATLRNYV